jgi:hypothetical protein
MTTPLPTTKPSDERAGGGTLFAGLAIPYMLGALVISVKAASALDRSMAVWASSGHLD